MYGPLEVVRSALVDIIEDRPVAADVPAVTVLHDLVSMVNVPQDDLAAVLGVVPRTLQRWLVPGAKGPSGDDEARVRVVAQLVNQLRHSFTAPGVMSGSGASTRGWRASYQVARRSAALSGASVGGPKQPLRPVTRDRLSQRPVLHPTVGRR